MRWMVPSLYSEVRPAYFFSQCASLQLPGTNERAREKVCWKKDEEEAEDILAESLESVRGRTGMRPEGDVQLWLLQLMLRKVDYRVNKKIVFRRSDCSCSIKDGDCNTDYVDHNSAASCSSSHSTGFPVVPDVKMIPSSNMNLLWSPTSK